jgi:hypothetical protein
MRMSRSKRPGDPADPAVDAEEYGELGIDTSFLLVNGADMYS